MLHPRADQPVVQGRGQAAQVGVLRQDLNDRLGFAELLGDLRPLPGSAGTRARSSGRMVLHLPPMIERKRSFRSDNFWMSAAVACAASSDVGASITARMVSSFGGKNLSNAASRLRQGSSCEISLLTSASMANRRAA